jgi:hypothetical protein
VKGDAVTRLMRSRSALRRARRWLRRPTQEFDTEEGVCSAKSEQAVATPEMTRAEILALAQSGVGYSIGGAADAGIRRRRSIRESALARARAAALGVASAVPNMAPTAPATWDRPGKVPTRQSPTMNRHPYSTVSKNDRTHWYSIKRSELCR